MGQAARREGSLDDYRAKRDFTATPEPTGATRPGADRPDTDKTPRFVVQRHRARRLHYDFRLEVHGVLVSWALPKGPTLDPSVRTLAVHVEDHPLEYRDFEGVIPKGQYGAGDVIVWDRGTWEPAGADDPAAAIAGGEIHFDLHGEKLRGRFVLVRTRGDARDREQWLMLHKHDDDARAGWRPEHQPRSVKSGRTNEEVAADPEAMWHSDRPAQRAEERVGRPRWSAPTRGELQALDALADNGRWELGGHELKLTNLDKVLFDGRTGEDPVTKRDLVRYYASIAPVMLPYLADRPVNMHRFPAGTAARGFWHKEVPDHAPDWLSRWRNPDARPGESEHYAVVDSPAALAWMANFAAVELHAWTSRLPNVREPTWALIDLDPGTKTSFDDVLVLARLFRTALDHLGVLGLPKVTGRRGIHIWVPLEAGYTFDETRSWVGAVSHAVGNTVPDLVSWTWEKSRRKGLARLDYTQNAINKTLVAPYSVRAAPGAPVSVPIEWEELDDPGLRSDGFTLRTLPGRIAERGDPFSRLLDRPQRLPDL